MTNKRDEVLDAAQKLRDIKDINYLLDKIGSRQTVARYATFLNTFITKKDAIYLSIKNVQTHSTPSLLQLIVELRTN